MPVSASKTCSKCRKVKTMDLFYKNKSTSDGYHKQCKECMNETGSNYRKANSDDLKSRRAEFREEKSAYDKMYYEKNKDRIKARSRSNWPDYYSRNREDILTKSRQRYVDNAEEERGRSRRYYASNPDVKRKSVEKRRAQKQGSVVGEYLPTISELVEFYGKFCLYPGCDASEATLDHVTPLSKGGSHTADNFQPLCGYHNSSKHAKDIDYREGKVWISRRTDADNFI